MTWFDLLIISITGLSILLAWVQGIMRELTVLIALAAGAWMAWISHGALAGLIGLDKELYKLILLSIEFIVIFLIALIFLNIMLGKLVSHRPGRIDRIAGGLFGLARGWFLAGLFYLALLFLFEADRMPDGVTGALTHSYAKWAGETLQGMGLGEKAPAQDSVKSAESV